MKATIKLCMIAILLSGVGVHARAAGDDRINFRDNDPFLFCSDGQINKATRCWAPVYPFQGQYVIMPYCHPNPKGKPWSLADKRSLQEYMRICPKSEQPGGWEGLTPPNVTPHVH